MQDHLSKGEIAKDAVQSGAEATAGAVGKVAGIVTGAVRDVATAVGGLATDLSRSAMPRGGPRATTATSTDPGGSVEGAGGRGGRRTSCTGAGRRGV